MIVVSISSNCTFLPPCKSWQQHKNSDKLHSHLAHILPSRQQLSARTQRGDQMRLHTPKAAFAGLLAEIHKIFSLSFYHGSCLFSLSLSEKHLVGKARRRLGFASLLCTHLRVFDRKQSSSPSSSPRSYSCSLDCWFPASGKERPRPRK